MSPLLSVIFGSHHTNMNLSLSPTSTQQSDVIKEHNKHVVQPPRFDSRSVARYLRSRFSSLVVPKEELAQYSYSDIFNPFKALASLSGKNWCYFLLAFWIWTFDALDFFAVSLNMSHIAQSLDKKVSDVSWGVTLTLFLRAVGAFFFGLYGDHYGRRHALMLNLFCLSVLQIGTGFVKSYSAFLGVRALFGCIMGGIFGNAAAHALDDCPPKARGVVSGIFQQGYAFGYLLAVIFTRAIVDNSPHGWRALFWFSSGPPVILIVCLYFSRETVVMQQNLDRRRLEKSNSNSPFAMSVTLKNALKRYWLVTIYLVLMMAGFNYCSHGSQDLYPSLLTESLRYGNDRSTVTNCVANLGAMLGGFAFGHFSTFLGRRATVIYACILGGACIYPWAYVRSSWINAGAFFLQAGVQGAWGVAPIHLSELSPPMYRSIVSGVSYQLGNLASGASSTIESTIGERFPINKEGEEAAYDYAKVMSIFMGCAFAYLMIIIFLGPENRGASFGAERDDHLDDEFGTVGVKESLDGDSFVHNQPPNSNIDKSKEKPATQHVEAV